MNLKTWAGMACAFVSSKGRERMNQNSKGFTLTELMIVVAIMGILGLTGVLSVTQVLPGYRLQKAASDMVGNFRKARSMAIKFNRPVSVVFYVAINKYTVDGSNATANSQHPINLPINYGSSVKFGTPASPPALPESSARTASECVHFTLGSGGADAGDAITFNTTGLTGGVQGYVYIQNSKRQGYRIGVSNLAANIRMDKCGSAGVDCLTNP